MPINTNPKVSVVIPAFNSARYIREAIESVFDQDYCDYEIIVIDDGSTDSTLNIVKSYSSRINILTQDHKGPGAARNLGVHHAQGDYIAFLDSDDIWLYDKLRTQVAVLDAEPNLSFVCSEAFVFTDDDGVIDLWQKDPNVTESFECLLENNFITTLTVLMRRSCFKAVKGFDERLLNAQDYDLWLRLTMNKYKFKYICKPLAKYRRHQMNNTRNTDQRVRSYELLLKKKDIWMHMPIFKKRKRLAGISYGFANTYLSNKQYSKAARFYLKSVLYHPAAGYIFFPASVHASYLYKIFRAYYLIIKCSLMSISQSKEGVLL
jgi:glycosyltransferase involved in cell wall biosynthesis